MSPAYIPELPTGEGGMNPILFEPQNSEGLFLYEQETADPYKETASFSTPSTFELPQVVAKPKEESALERYMREQREEEENKRQQQATEKSAFDLANRDYLKRRSVFDQTPLEMAVEIQAVNKAKKEAFDESFQKDFGWLNGQEHPDWPEYISQNYSNWEELTPAQKDDVFEHWRSNESKYYVGYANVDPEVFQKKFSDKWFNNPENQEIVDNKIFIAQEKLKSVPSLSIPFTRSFGYESGESIDSSFYKSNKAGLMAARGFQSMSEMAESVKKIQKRTGVNILNEDGTINVEKVKQARQEHNAQIQELKNVDAYDPETDDLSANFDSLVGYTNTVDPNKKWNDVKTAVKALNEIQSLLNIKEKKFNDAIESSDGFFETAWSFLSEPGTSARFFGGQFAAQMIDTAPETIGAAVAAGPAVGYFASGFIGGSQEERLVAKELITKAMVEKGYDPDNIADWQKASEEKDDIITNAKNAATRKGFATSPVENALELVFSYALRGTKFLGRFSKTRKGLSYLTAGGVAAAGGEVSGQMAAYGEVDTGEVAGEVIGNIFGLTGPATFKAAGKAAGKIKQKVFGKKDETQTTAAPPQAPTAETTTRQKTQEEIALEKEQARRNVKATGTTQEGTGPTTPPTQENVTEEDVGDGTVTGTGQQAVARSARESAEAILNPDTQTTTRTAVSLEQISQEIDSLIDNIVKEEERFRQSPESARLLNQDLALQEAGLTQEEIASRRLPSNEPRVALPGRGGVSAQLYDFGTPVGNILTDYGPIDIVILAPGPIAKPVVNQPLQQIIDSDEGDTIVEQMIAAASKVEERLPKTETLPEVKFETPAPAELLQSFRDDNNTLPEKARAAWTDEVYSKVDAYFKSGDEANLDGLNDIQKRRARTHLNAAPEAAEAKARGMSVDELARKKRAQGGFLTVPNIEGVKQAAIKTWTKAKDFASWAKDMLNQFGKVITPYLQNLWNDLNSLIRNVGEYFTYTNARARQRGSVDLRQGGEIQLEQDKDYLAAVESGDMETAQRIVDLLQGETRIRLTPEEKNFAQWMIDGPMGDADSISEVLERNVSSDELPKIDGDYLVLSSGEFVRDAEYRVGTQIEDMIEDALSDASITKAEAAKQRRAARSLTAKLSSALQESVVRDEQGNIIPPSQRFLNKVEGNPKKFSLQSKPPLTQQDREYAEAEARGDVKTGQRMADEAAKAAGYNVGPLWHGSWRGDFNIFKPSSHGKVGRGMYFTNDKKVAEFHAKGRDGDWGKNVIYRAYLKGRFLETGTKPRPGYLMGEDVLLPQEVVEALNAKGITRGNGDPVTKYTSLQRVFNPGGWKSNDSQEISNIIEGLGYSGIILYSPDTAADTETVVFNPSQIKSADPFTYDDQGNLIPLSQRFNTASPDIRFSLARTQQEFSPNSTIRVFHGTKSEKQFPKFREKQGGIWFAFNKENAEPGSGDPSKRVFQADVNLGSNPVVLTPELHKEWQQSGTPMKWMMLHRARTKATSIIIPGYAVVAFSNNQISPVNDARFNKVEGNPNLGQNQQRTSLIRKTEAFFGGKIPNNVTFVNDRSEGNRFVARINATLTGQADIEINYAFADDSNINSALYEEIGHFASNRGMLTDFYNSLTPTEKADIDTAVSMYGKSEARMAETSVAALQAEERSAKSFAAIASRNKDLWTRIKNLVNKILSKIGIVSANTDNQVADIFLRAMNAYKNQRENNPDFSNRRITFGKTSFYSKPTARQEIDKAMDKIKESKDSPIRSLFNSINLSNLSKEKRNELQDRMKAYADATKAIIRGTEILNPEESKQRFDDLIQYLSDFKKTAWEEQFKKLQEKYSSSLKDKTADEFTSAKAVIAYVADLDNADSKKIIEDQKKKEDKKREATEKKDENEGAQVTLALEAQSNINEILNTAPYKEMSPDNKIWTMEAMEYLETLDPTQQTQRQNEALVATINSAIEGNIIGFGKYTAARRIQMFLADLNAYIKDNGGKIPWYTAAKTRRIRRSVESFVSSEKTSQFFKKETIERMIFSHPELRDMWIKNLGNYFEKVQTANSSLQNELDKKLQASFEKHGLKEKTFAGNVKDKQLFSDKTRKSKARMMVAAMITQWTDGSNDPIGEINKAISDVFTGINNEIKIQAFSGARGVSNLDSFNSLINPLIRDGFLIREGNTFEVQATPEVWNEAVLNALQKNEKNALIEIRNTASLLQDRLKFTKEFWYGEEFEAVVNYVPKQAYNTSPDVKEESAPELNEGSFTSLPENPSLRRQGSVLFARQGLGKDQYYTLDIERAATKAIKSAAYEVTTAPERIMMHKAFNSDELLPYFGNEDNSSKSRRNTMRETLKAVHKAEMHIGTAPKRATSTEGVLFSKAGEMFTTLIGAQILGKVKNIASQYLSPIAGSTVIAGQDIFNGMVQLNTNDEWKADNGAAIKALYAIGFPDLEHRSEIIDFFYDVSSNTDLVKDIAKISLNENLTEEQKKEVIFAKVTAALDAGINVNKYISQMVNTKPDAWAAKHVFPGLLINRLKKAGVINKADEFVPAVMNDPRTEDALSKAKQDMSTAFGNANRYSLRPEFFVDRSKNSFIRNTLFSVAQTATSMAGDVIVAAKDASYFNSADKYASQIRKEGAKRLSAIALQTYIFAFISKVVTLQVLKYGALLFGKAEGLDEEEEQNLRNRIAINQELGMQDISQRAMSDMISNTMGFIGTNSATRFFSNIASKKAMEKLLYADYEEKKKELEDKIKKEKNPSKKTDLQFQLELIKKGKQKLSIVFDDPSLGPTVDYFLNTLGSIDDPTQADFDALAEEYYKRGGLEKKPERNEALRYLGKFAGYAIPDIYAARQEAYKARKEVADKRKQRLESEEQKSKKNIDKINIPLISYP